MKRAFLFSIVGIVSFIGLCLIGVMAISLMLPDVAIMKTCMTTSMNKVSLCKTGPDYTPLSQISDHVKSAVLVSEDAAFYQHNGVDTNELKESIKTDIMKGRFARGASTITQQLAKNVFLTKDKSLTRKVKELYIAFQIEKNFSKNQILETYLNVVEFGPKIYGIKSGARFYFSKAPSQLSPQEAAFLAFLLPNPPKYSQSYFKGQLTPFARSAIHKILFRMKASKKISDTDYDVAAASLKSFPWKTALPAAPDGYFEDGVDCFPTVEDTAFNPADTTESDLAPTDTGDFKYSED